MKFFSYLLLFIFLTTTLFSQNSLKGKVVDATSGAPLNGATIRFNNKGGTTTNNDGLFTVDCKKVSSVTVSFIGYTSKKVSIKNCIDEVNISLLASKNSLDEVEITATSNQNKSMLFQPISITKLGEDELKRGTGLFLDDAINGNVPGVTMQRRTVSAGQQFNIRGYGNGSRGTRGVSSNFDTQGAKVYLNGIPITDAEGITTMDDIDFGSIGNVEVTKGPAGTLYGLAIAGVVNLKTIKPEKGKTTIGQDVLMGSYGLQRYTTHFAMGGNHSSLLINYGKQKSDGYMLHSASTKDFVNIAADFQPNEKQAITTYIGFSNSYDDRGGELTLAQYAALDYTGNPEYIKRNAHSNVVTFRAGVGHIYKFNDNISNTTSIFGIGFSSNVSSAGGWTDKTAINYGFRSTTATKFFVGKGILLSGITGIESQQQRAQTIGYTMVKNPADTSTVTNWKIGYPYWIVGATTSNQVVTAGTTSLFTQWTLSLPKNISVTAGIGVSDMKIVLDDRLYEVTKPNKPTNFERSYKGMVSPNISINKVFNNAFSVYASYTKGYKAPVSSYFFIPYSLSGATPIPNTGIVNTTLKPEIGNQYEIGAKGNTANDKLTYELSFFNAMFINKMTAVAVPLTTAPNTTAYSYVVNGGRQNHKGVEALIKYTAYQSNETFFKKIRPFANLAYSDFKYEDFRIQKSVVLTEDYSGKQVAGIAKVTANVGVDVMMKYGLYANINYLYKDGMPITSDELYYTTSYGLLNAKMGMQQNIGKRFATDIFVGSENITGTQYPYMVFVNQLPDAYLPAPINATFYGGVSLKYNF